MDGILWDGLLVWTGNHWEESLGAEGALRRIGATREADLLSAAVNCARQRGYASARVFKTESANKDAATFTAFSDAQTAIEAAWVSLWDQAEAYARTQGWSGESKPD